MNSSSVNEEKGFGDTSVGRETEQRVILRELDAKIAVKVMGHEVRVNDDDMLFAYHRRWVYRGEKYIWWKRGGYQPEVYLPHYSTLMVDAILVLDHMRDRGYRLGVNPDNREGCSFCGAPPRSYTVWFESESRKLEDGHIAEAATLPEAICRAALALVNIPDPPEVSR